MTLTRTIVATAAVCAGVLATDQKAPVCVDEGEDCWRQNRRAHQILTAK